MSKILIVGELNPYGADPYFALYHLPRHASGNRLREIFGVPDHIYEKFSKINLCYGKWSLPAARAAVKAIREEPDSSKWPHVVVMLGAKVKKAFNMPIDIPFFEAATATPIIVSLPHPSGRNLLWNDPFSYVRAREIMRKVAPDVPWGSSY